MGLKVLLLYIFWIFWNEGSLVLICLWKPELEPEVKNKIKYMPNIGFNFTRGEGDTRTSSGSGVE